MYKAIYTTIYLIPGGAQFGYIRLFAEHNMDSRKDISSRLNIAIEIRDKLAEAWSYYGLFYDTKTEDIINPLDGRMKNIKDLWERIKNETPI